jgi:hypothetical protein
MRGVGLAASAVFSRHGGKAPEDYASLPEKRARGNLGRSLRHPKGWERLAPLIGPWLDFNRPFGTRLILLRIGYLKLKHWAILSESLRDTGVSPVPTARATAGGTAQVSPARPVEVWALAFR